MKPQISIDLETLGTLVDSQILSIGACKFDLKTGEIFSTFHHVIQLPNNMHLNVTEGTIKFLLMQDVESKTAIWDCETKISLLR